MMIYLHSYNIQHAELIIHHFYNIEDDNYYAIRVGTYEIEYQKGYIMTPTFIAFHQHKIGFEYTLPSSIDKLIFLDNSNNYNYNDYTTKRLRDLENSKLKLILNSI